MKKNQKRGGVKHHVGEKMFVNQDYSFIPVTRNAAILLQLFVVLPNGTGKRRRVPCPRKLQKRLLMLKK